jgi:hypothetical protein
MAYRRNGDTWRTVLAWEDTGGVVAPSSGQRRPGMLLTASRDATTTTYGPTASSWTARDIPVLVAAA